eukprot:m.345833 g.345833  ORF g.345833 m.345833 type:complete len:390 (-) comp27434_c0_seq1:1842-3011(-)
MGGFNLASTFLFLCQGLFVASQVCDSPPGAATSFDNFYAPISGIRPTGSAEISKVNEVGFDQSTCADLCLQITTPPLCLAFAHRTLNNGDGQCVFASSTESTNSGSNHTFFERICYTTTTVTSTTTITSQTTVTTVTTVTATTVTTMTATTITNTATETKTDTDTEIETFEARKPPDTTTMISLDLQTTTTMEPTTDLNLREAGMDTVESGKGKKSKNSGGKQGKQLEKSESRKGGGGGKKSKAGKSSVGEEAREADMGNTVDTGKQGKTIEAVSIKSEKREKSSKAKVGKDNGTSGKAAKLQQSQFTALRDTIPSTQGTIIMTLSLALGAMFFMLTVSYAKKAKKTKMHWTRVQEGAVSAFTFERMPQVFVHDSRETVVLDDQEVIVV